MKFELDEYHRNASSEELLMDIKNVANKLGKNTVTMIEYQTYGKFHPCTLQRRFGSWFNVLKKANLEKSRSIINIPEDELFKNIEEIWIKLGKQPKYGEIKKPVSKFSAGTYERRFGSWRKALEKFVQYINSDIDSEQAENAHLKDICINTITTSDCAIKHKTKREISDRMRFRIILRDGCTCKKCGRSPLKEMGVELHVDHIIPWSKGGETIPENLETKCEKCNLGKGNAFNE